MSTDTSADVTFSRVPSSSSITSTPHRFLPTFLPVSSSTLSSRVIGDDSTLNIHGGILSDELGGIEESESSGGVGAGGTGTGTGTGDALARVAEEISELKAIESEQRAELEAIVRSNAESAGGIRRLEREYGEVQAEERSLQIKCLQADSEMHQLTQELTRYETQRRQVEDRIARLFVENATVGQKMGDMEKRVQRTFGSFDDFLNSARRLVLKTSETGIKYMKAREQEMALVTRVTELEGDCHVVAGRLEEMFQRERIQAARLDEIQKGLNSSNADVQKKRRAIQQLDPKLVSQLKENEATRAEIGRLEKEIVSICGKVEQDLEGDSDVGGGVFGDENLQASEMHLMRSELRRAIDEIRNRKPVLEALVVEWKRLRGM